MANQRVRWEVRFHSNQFLRSSNNGMLSLSFSSGRENRKVMLPVQTEQKYIGQKSANSPERIFECHWHVFNSET